MKEGKECEAQLFFDSLSVVGGNKLLVDVNQMLIDIQEDISVASPEVESVLATVGAFDCHDVEEQIQYLICEGDRLSANSMDIAERVRHLLLLVESSDSSLENSVALNEIRSLTLDLMLGQMHQDLSQQLLKKILKFVTSLESNLCMYVDLNKAKVIPSGLGPSVISRDLGVIATDQTHADILFESGKRV